MISPYYFGQEYHLTPYTQDEETKLIELKASIHRTIDSFQIVFTLIDQNEIVQIPFHKRSPERVQGLWNETCFEFFITDNKNHYAEGNATLDFGWNIFWFNSYRENPLKEFAITKNKNPIRDIYLSGKKSQMVLDVPQELAEKFNSDFIKFSITTVLKLKNGNTHYYALKHSDEKPNFHHRESFLTFK